MADELIVVGGGAAGMMAAISAAETGAAVRLLERNPKVGRKLYITGKGRCNVTNHCPPEEVLASTPRNGRFLYGAVTRTPPAWVEDFFTGLGVPLKVERGNRVFPVSDRAADVIDALFFHMKKLNIPVTQARASQICLEEGRVSGVETDCGFFPCRAAVLATGGCSYPATGSTGDGYEMARALGHTVVSPVPSLVPLEAEEDFCGKMQGLALKNVSLRVKNQKGKVVYQEQGELLFTHFGLSGPLVLSASAHMRDFAREQYTCVIDLKPALEEQKLDARLVRELSEQANRDFQNVLGSLVPRLMVPTVIALTGIPGDRKAHDMTKGERRRLLEVLKGLVIPYPGSPAHCGGHHHLRRREGGGGRPQDHGVEKGARPVLRRGAAGRGCLYRGLQPPDRLGHRPGGRGKRRPDLPGQDLGSRGLSTVGPERRINQILERNKKCRKKALPSTAPPGPERAPWPGPLARELGYLYVDTGAIYRTVALRAWRQAADPSDPEQIAPLLKGLDLRMDYGADGVQRMYLSGRDVTEAIRVHQISGLASQVAALPPVRDFLLDFQRRQAMEHDVVMDGRDIGTVVLPHAGAKVFLTAAPEARARRRLLELKQRGQEAEL